MFLRKDEEREHSTLTLHPDGGVSLGYMLDAGPTKVEGLPDTKDTEQMITEVEAAEKAIAEPAEPVVTVAKPPEKPETLNRMPGAFPDTRPMIQRVGTAEPETPRVTPAAAQEDESAPPKTEAAEDERQRVQLVGRLGRTPTIRETASKKLVAKFPLAVHLENGETAWHDVLTFGERAAGLKKRIEAGELVKGQEVEVVGYLHEREYKGRDGTPKTAQEIYSVAIKRR
ncbi:hypothetical protein VM98_19070 [Streptomyces rubellomurinus subsp. indigoferus]|nr:hypothetical protein VM98_19070 [Streptomyces rubellomurinus subsp. indigoferus]